MDLIYVIYYLAGLLSAYAFDDLSYNKSAIQSHTYRDTIYEAVNRQRGRFAGFSLYVSFTGDIQGSILCYKDGPQLPPLNFTTTCTEHGRYVIFYKERLDGAKYPAEYETGNVYTELCEVIVQGCKVSGVFGINCDKPCPANCKDNLCHIENGSCYWCKTGWTGKFCDTACQPGYFGENCSMPCSPNCKTCRNTDGLVPVRLVGWVIIVLQNVLSPMEKIASIRAVYIVSTRHVTDLTETVGVMSNLENIFETEIHNRKS
ncbi:uncharacterized protein [Magallana gigas]|uniref:uncharacterized protein n=1 Tax=Magallana gigas TaxID=29159 RepID=UPI0033424360